jgi:hypothetical protein
MRFRSFVTRPLNLSLSLLFMVLITVGCARSDRAVQEQAQAKIDQRQYSEAIVLLEKEIPNHEGDAQALKTQLAYAYLGRSGVELLQLADNMKIFKSFKDMKLTPEQMQRVCTQVDVGIGGIFIGDICLPVIHFTYFPESDQPDFMHALALFTEIYPEPSTTNSDINLLLAVVDLASSIKNYEHLLTPPDVKPGIDGTISRQDKIVTLTHLMKYMKRSVDSLFLGVNRLMFSYGKIRRFFDKYKDKPLLRLGNHTYYLTDRLSADDFFQFILLSGKDALKTQEDRAKANKNLPIHSYSEALEDALSALQWKVNLQESSIRDAISHFLSAGAEWVPDHLSLDSTQSFNFDLLQVKDMPKFLQDLIGATRDSWKQENATMLFDEMDNLNYQLQTLNFINSSWTYFWQNLDDPTRLGLKANASHYRDQIPVVVIDPSHPNVNALKTWHLTAIRSLSALSEQMTRDYPNDSTLKTLPDLVNETSDWISTNLW